MLRKVVHSLLTVYAVLIHSSWNEHGACFLCMHTYVLHVYGPPLQSSCGHACPVCSYMCICVFAANPPYKRGHRKTASFGTILDVPKIVVTGITGLLVFPVTRWNWLEWACGLLSSDMAFFCVSLHMIPSRMQIMFITFKFSSNLRSDLKTQTKILKKTKKTHKSLKLILELHTS